MIKAIVTDIEGTTSSITFVKDVLFPYAREHMGDFIQAHAAEPTVSQQLDAVREMVGREISDEQVVGQLLQWIDEDRKVTPLKSLQGMIWEAGYREGDFKGHIFEDAARNLQAWQEAGVRLYVFSSGSVQAQKLLFMHTSFGDMTPLFSGYFDTNIGAKQDVTAYRHIVDALDVEPSEILFLSDIKAELDAAREAEMHTCWLVREGDLNPGAEHRQVASFDEIDLEMFISQSNPPDFPT